jgi:hypothetical protein
VILPKQKLGRFATILVKWKVVGASTPQVATSDKFRDDIGEMERERSYSLAFRDDMDETEKMERKERL